MVQSKTIFSQKFHLFRFFSQSNKHNKNKINKKNSDLSILLAVGVGVKKHTSDGGGLLVGVFGDVRFEGMFAHILVERNGVFREVEWLFLLV